MAKQLPKKRSNTFWILLIIAPFAILFFVAFLQILVNFLISRGGSGLGNGVVIFVNIISVILGMAAVVSFVGIPVWITMLIKSSSKK